jgi:short-subunit dehydrogenase
VNSTYISSSSITISLTVAVNNAGLSRGRTIPEGTYADNSITLKANLLAPFLLTKEFLPAMIRRNHGHIFNVASMSAYIPPPGLADYAASKAGLIAFHEVSSPESGPVIPLQEIKLI